MTKQSGRRAAPRGKHLALAVAAAFLPWGEAYALPTGEQVATPGVTVTRPTSQSMQIDQGVQKGIVNWQGFSIGASEHVNVTQPNASAALLNRVVVGNSPSEIFGRLTANGQVFLVNNAGVLFAPGASVSVGSLLASSLSITDADFLAGNYLFFREGNPGNVVNAGSIVTAGGGYTALIAPQVRNDGVIIANSGKVALGAGDRVSLDMVGDGLVSINVDQAAFNASLVNTGTIQADGGTVLLKASSANALLDTVINTSGVIRANSLVERNGEIVLDGGGAGVVAVDGALQAAGGTVALSGDKIALLDGARVDVSSDAGGGTVSTHANALWVGPGAAVNADALQSGDGGRVVLWSADSTQVHGTVTARGAGDGSGGFVETSGAYLEVSRAPEVSAGGTWLIDPFNILVVAGAGLVNNGGAMSFTPNGEDSQIGADLISGQLNAGANVTLDTGVAGAQEGDVTFSAAVSKGALNASTLTVNAADDVVINAAISMASGNFNVTAGGDMVVTSSATMSGGSMNITLGGGLSVLGNGTFASLTAQNGQTITARSVDVTAQAGGSANITNGSFGMVTPGNQVITITGGAPNTGLSVQARASGGSAFVTNFAPTEQRILASNAGYINVVGEAGAAGLQANAGNQTVSITGAGANAVRIGSATATGASTVNGFNQTITAGNVGESGSITITGSNGGGGPTHFANIGVGVANPQTVRTSGTLSVTGGTAAQGRGAAGIFQNNPAEQRISAANVVLQGGLTGPGNGVFINSTFGGGQLFNVAGDISVTGEAGGNAGIFNGSPSPQTISAPQTINAGNVLVQGGPSGTNNGAFVGSNFGGDQTLTVPGEIRVTGGAGGIGNRAGITTNANQTINGNPNIVLTGGGGGQAGNGNNVFIQSTGTDKAQTINATRIELRSGAGIDASATLNAARQVIHTIGDVSLFGGGGLGATNGVRIGGIGGSTLGPTNLTLGVGGNLLLHGGSANGVSLGSSGASTQANNIAVTAGNVTLESEGAGARIGSSGQVAVTPGNITVTAAGSLQLGNGTAVRVNGPITLTANSLTNDGTITNGGGTSTANVILNANAFDLNGGNIQGGNAAVILRPRTATNSFGIESAGATTLTNADIASINTSNFVVFGSGIGTTFTGNMTIGENAPVDGGTKSLAFFRSTLAPGTIMIGANGIRTTSDVILGAGGGAILSSGGTVAGDEVQLRASQGIGAPEARVQTAANALAILNTGGVGSAFVSEAGDVTLRTVVLNVGGITNSANNFTSGAFDFAASGAVDVAGPVSSVASVRLGAGGALTESSGGAITAPALTTTSGGSTNLGGTNQVASFNGTSSGDLSLTNTGTLAVTGLNAAGNATLNNAGNVTVTGPWNSSGADIAIGSDLIVDNASITAFGAMNLDVSGAVVVSASSQNADLTSFGPQTIHAQSLAVIAQNGYSASITSAPVFGGEGHQTITVSGGNVELQALNGGAMARIAVNAVGGTQTVSVRDGDYINVNGANGGAEIFTNGVQTISITGSGDNEISFGSVGALGSSIAVGAAQQVITAGLPGERGAIRIVGPDALGSFAGFTDNPVAEGKQTVSTSGALSILGGRSGVGGTSSGVFHNGGGEQRIHASRIELQGGPAGASNAAFIRANSSDQYVDVDGDIHIVAGVGGDALIQGSPNGLQTVYADNISIANGFGGTNSFGTIRAAHQEIHAASNVVLTGGATGGTIGGVRIGGLSGAPTDLQLFVGGDLILTGGSAPSNSAIVGSTGSAAVTNAIYIETGRGVVLNSGTGSGARIGSGSALAGGSIEIHADGGIELNGATPQTATAIRTLGNVTLDAASISEASSGFVLANTLTTTTSGNTSLTGPNQVASFNASSGGDLTLSNTGALTVTSLNAVGDATLTNGGAVALTGPWRSANATISVTGAAPTIVETGAGSVETNSLTISANDGLTLGGANRIGRLHATTFTGDLVFNNTGALEVAQVDVDDVTFTNAGSVTVNGLWNSSATSIMTTGAGADLTVNDNVISAVGPMNVDVAGALAVNASSGDAGLRAFGPVAGQAITARSVNLTALGGRRANIENFGAGNQSIAATAGDMNLQVPGGFGVAQIINTAPGADQTVSVNGQINVLGGVISPATSRNSGLFKQAPGGMQTVSASGITLQGASSLNTAGALISSQGDQYVDVTGGTINLIGGSGGQNNNATIAASAAGQQTILAHDISLSNGVGGIDTVAAIVGGHQTIDVTGNVTLSAQGAIASSPSALFGVRIGAPGGSATGTDLTLLVDGNLVLNGGGARDNGVGIGSSGAGAPRQNTIVIDAGGSVILNPGTAAATGARIGSSPQNGLAGGDISIAAGGDIQLNGVASATSIRTLGNVTLGAASISEAGNGFILANTLTTATTGSTNLIGPNRIARFNASSGGDLSLTNFGDLSFTGMAMTGGINRVNTGALNFSGSATFGPAGNVSIINTGALNVTSLFGSSATVINSGAVTVNGPWSSPASTSITTIGAGSDLTVNTFMNPGGPMNLNIDGAIRVAASGTQDASLTSFGGQYITARSVEVTSRDGRFASIGNNNTGDQTITVSGGGIDIDSVSGGGVAFITNSGLGNQIITVSEGSGIDVRSTSGAGSGQINNFGSGSQTITVSRGGGVEVQTLSGNGFALISNNAAGSQAIAVSDGTGIDVMSASGFALLSNFGSGNQTVSVSGGTGIDVQSNGGNASISQGAGFAQIITVTGADHISVNALAGNASIFSAGSQAISVTGAGVNNALSVGSAGAQGRSNIGGASQTIIAGASGESGRIDIFGVDAPNSFAGITTSFAPGAGNTQSVSTSGNITVRGGNAPFQFVFGTPPTLTTSNAGIFNNSNGLQTISAGSIVLRGGTGVNSGASIGSNAGGDQNVTVSGGTISVTGGDSGSGNRAGINTNANQTIGGAPVITLTGGTGSGAGGSNNAFIIGGGPGRTQTIDALSIELLSGADNSAVILAAKQVISTVGDLRLTGNPGDGTSGATRLGGIGGAVPGPSDVTLRVGGDLLLTAGGTNNPAIIGASTPPAGVAPPSHVIDIQAGGDVILQASEKTGARIGTSFLAPTAATGNISITAGGSIELHGVNGDIGPAVIRTADNVTLAAGTTIAQTGSGRVLASGLTTTSSGDTSLNGPNQVARFNATSTDGSVSLNNTGVLEVTGMAAVNDATITNIGDVTVTGAWTVGGTSTITVGSDIVVSAPMASQDVVLIANDGAILEAPTGSITADTLTTFSSGETLLVGPNQVDSFSATSSGDLILNNTSANLTLGNIETNGGAFALTQGGDMTVTTALAFPRVNLGVTGSLALLGGSAPGSAAEITGQGPIDISVGGDLRLAGGSGDGAFARIHGYSDINLTVGGFLTMNAGSGRDAWARVQLASRDSVIHLNFPNLTSGGYFVNGVEGLLRDGKTGFLADNGVAAPDHQFITTYGVQ